MTGSNRQGVHVHGASLDHNNQTNDSSSSSSTNSGTAGTGDVGSGSSTGSGLPVSSNSVDTSLAPNTPLAVDTFLVNLMRTGVQHYAGHWKGMSLAQEEALRSEVWHNAHLNSAHHALYDQP